MISRLYDCVKGVCFEREREKMEGERTNELG